MIIVMGNEAYPEVVAPEIDPAVQAEIDRTGGEAHYIATMGLGADQLATEVGFGDFRGPLIAALADDKCPVKDMLIEGFQVNGVEGAQEKLNLLSMLAGNTTNAQGETIKKFEVTINERTRELVKKKIWLNPSLVSPR
ncbi:MAG: hypothetical protein JWN38_811 [Candidatus Saccharibacteria bacterium]|nr:hypothetical protein [Candidatus Saccharibacteria bacterium]